MKFFLSTDLKVKSTLHSTKTASQEITAQFEWLHFMIPSRDSKDRTMLCSKINSTPGKNCQTAFIRMLHLRISPLTSIISYIVLKAQDSANLVGLQFVD